MPINSVSLSKIKRIFKLGFISGVLIFLSQFAFSQNLIIPINKLGNGTLCKEFDGSISPQNKPNLRTTSGSASRLIARSFYNYDPTFKWYLNDSSSNYYSAGRGWDNRPYLGWKWDTLVDVSGDLSYWYREIQTFDANNNPMLFLKQYWIPTISNWRNSYQISYTYDGVNNMTSFVQDRWNDTTLTWDHQIKTTFSYDGSGNNTMRADYAWDTIGNIWSTQDSLSCFYATGNLCFYEFYFVLNGTSIVPSLYDSYTYDGYGNQILDIGKSWDSATSTWLNLYKWTDQYDIWNRDTLHAQYLFDSSSGLWINPYVTHFTYFGDSIPDSSSFYSQVSSSTSMQNFLQGFYKYDENGNVTSFLFLQWNYYLAGFDSLKNKFDTLYKIHYYYEPFISGIENINTSILNALVYPIPTCGMLYVLCDWTQPESSTILLTDLKGRISQKISNEPSLHCTSVIDTKGLHKGDYLLSIIGANGETYHKTIVVE